MALSAVTSDIGRDSEQCRPTGNDEPASGVPGGWTGSLFLGETDDSNCYSQCAPPPANFLGTLIGTQPQIVRVLVKQQLDTHAISTVLKRNF